MFLHCPQLENINTLFTSKFTKFSTGNSASKKVQSLFSTVNIDKKIQSRLEMFSFPKKVLFISDFSGEMKS